VEVVADLSCRRILPHAQRKKQWALERIRQYAAGLNGAQESDIKGEGGYIVAEHELTPIGQGVCMAPTSVEGDAMGLGTYRGF